jgi:hypothetical protein
VIRVVAACVCLALAVTLQISRDRAFPRSDPETQRLLYVRSPEAIKRMALGFDALAADVYWIRAIQHYGGDRLDRGRLRRYDMLYPLLDMATSLDPYFNIAYRFGAIFLSEAYPGGAGRPDYAVALLRKGIAAQPGKWQYYHDIAFVNYWALRDPVAAAGWFRRAAEQPGAPNWLMPVAAAMLTEGSDRASSRFLWQQMLGADQDWLRRRAEHGLRQLDALDEIDRLQAKVQQVPTPKEQLYTWDWLIRAGALPGVPLDPSGTPYQIDPDSGRVNVSQSSLLFPLPKPLDARR